MKSNIWFFSTATHVTAKFKSTRWKPTVLTLWDPFMIPEGEKLLSMSECFPIIIGMRLLEEWLFQWKARLAEFKAQPQKKGNPFNQRHCILATSSKNVVDQRYNGHHSFDQSFGYASCNKCYKAINTKYKNLFDCF